MAIYYNNEAKPTADSNRVILPERELTLQSVFSDLVLNSGNGNGTPMPPPPKLQHFTSPLDWSQKRKTLITTISCAVTVLAGYAAGAYSPPQAQLVKEWKVSDTVYNLGITAYTLGFAIAPMVLAPLSEVLGRRPVFLASGFLFIGKLT